MTELSQTENREAQKTITLRWPKSLWLAITALAKKQDTSLQTIITVAVLDRYGITNWKVKHGIELEEAVEKILKAVESMPTTQNQEPEDLKEKIARAIRMAREEEREDIS